MLNLSQADLFSLDNNSPDVLFFFGLAGSGKTYLVNLLGKLTNWKVYDADTDLTNAMKKALSNKESFTDEMRFEYIQKVVIRINQLTKEYPKLLVAQANYKLKYRDYVRENINSTLEFIHVKASDKIIYNRLEKRDDNLSPDYFKKISKNFEEPREEVRQILNIGSDEDLINGFLKLY